MVTAIIFLILVGLPTAAYAYWIWRMVRQKRWRFVAGQITIPVVLFLAAWSGLYWYAVCEDRRYWEDVLTVSASLGEPTFRYHSERAFNGDGYSIEVFPLPDAVALKFKNYDSGAFAGFPKRPDYRSHWKVHTWSRSPFDPDLKEYLDFAGLSGQRTPEIETQIRNMRDALKGDTTYYAFFYYDPSGHVGDIDFFVVDLKARLFYVINSNT